MREPSPDESFGSRGVAKNSLLFQQSIDMPAHGGKLGRLHDDLTAQHREFRAERLRVSGLRNDFPRLKVFISAPRPVTVVVDLVVHAHRNSNWTLIRRVTGPRANRC